jgi:hypothetical protein
VIIALGEQKAKYTFSIDSALRFSLWRGIPGNAFVPSRSYLNRRVGRVEQMMIYISTPKDTCQDLSILERAKNQ